MSNTIRTINPKMKKLGARNYALISRGVKSSGSYDPEEMLFYFEEDLYVDEVDTIILFLEWVHAGNGSRDFGSGNYELRYKEFLNSLRKWDVIETRNFDGAIVREEKNLNTVAAEEVYGKIATTNPVRQNYNTVKMIPVK